MAAKIVGCDAVAGGGEVGGLVAEFGSGLAPAGDEEEGRSGGGAGLSVGEGDLVGGEERGGYVGGHCGCWEEEASEGGEDEGEFHCGLSWGTGENMGMIRWMRLTKLNNRDL